MKEIIEILHDGGFSCVICNGGQTRTFTQRGVADLYRLLREEPDLLRGADVADKVVGKAAAALMILGGVRRVHADIISEPAAALFRSHGTEVESPNVVPMIRNRDNTDFCPLEKLTTGESDTNNIYAIVEKFITSRLKMMSS